jgi:glycosyl transferase family 25
MICEKFRVNLIVSDIMYDSGAKFNKGKAINLAIQSIKDSGYILLIDADIIVKEKVNTENLDPETLYTSDRWMCESYEDLLRTEREFNGLKKYIRNESDRGLGFFQLFHTSKSISYPETSDNAAFSDLLFRDKFTNKENIENTVIHLGRSYTNWDGRTTDRFIEDEEFQKLFDSKKFNINDYFDKIYCLNLERNSEKWQKVNLQFKELNINVDRFLGIDGNNITDDEFKEISNRKISEIDSSKLGLIENKYALGCLMSHIEIIKEAKSAGYKRILIFEDDVILSDEFSERISQINKLNWELLYLGASQFNWSGVKVNNGFYKCSNTLGTFAYAINSNIYDDLLELFETKRKSIDNLLSEYQLKNKQSFVIYPNIVISDVSQSDIRQSKSMDEYSKLMKWNLESFTFKPEKFIPKEKLKVLLVPDRPGWAFDNISKSLKKYNPYVDEIEYDII